MKTLNLLIFLLMVVSCTNAQEDELLKVLNSQVEAFNQQDIDKLVENVTDEFKYFYITPNELIMEVEGKENFRKSMEAYFSADMKVITEIKSYTIEGNRISFKEAISYLNKKGERVYSSSMGVYQIIDGKITRSWYFSD